MFIIDNAEEIRRRLEEIEAEHKLALTGSNASVRDSEPVFIGISTGGTDSATLSVHQLPPYTPSLTNG